MKKKVKIICPIHGVFEMAPEHHLSGQNCPKCSSIDTESFIRRASEKYDNFYDYSKTEFTKIDEKVTITCPIHGDFEVIAGNHLYHNAGCQKCSKKERKNTEMFKEQVKEIFGDYYDLSLIDYKNNYTNVTLICPKHGEFSIRPDHLLNGAGCQKCAKERRIQTNEEFLEKVVNKIGDKYDLSKVNYVNSTTPIDVICRKHGVFKIRPYNLLNGRGCPHCANENRYSNTEEFVSKAKKIFPDYNYDMVEYVDNKTLVKVICPKHGVFDAIPAFLLLKRGCPYCQESTLETEVRMMLTENNLRYMKNVRSKELPQLEGLEIDFYLPDYNIGIECQGLQHFKPIRFFTQKRGATKSEDELNNDFEKQIERDKHKKELCDKNGITLLYYSNLHIEYPYKVYESVDELLNVIKSIINK